MNKIFKLSVCIFFFLTDSILLAEPSSSTECHPFFANVNQPSTLKTTSTNPKEILKPIDKKPFIVSSSLLKTQVRNWLVEVVSQKDTAEVLLNLLTRSNLSIDDSLYIISNLMLPQLSELKDINIEKESFRFYELLLDVLGMKDIQILITRLHKYNQELFYLLGFWSPRKLQSVHNEIYDLIMLIKEHDKLATNDILRELVRTVAMSKDFKLLNKIVSFDEKTMASLVSLEFSKKFSSDTLDSLCWEIYFNALQTKTLIALGNLLQISKRILANIENSSNSSWFLKENKANFLMKISSMMTSLKKLHSSIVSIDLQKIDGFRGLNNDEILSKLVFKLIPNSSIPTPENYEPYKEDMILIAPAWDIITSFYTSLATTYSHKLKDVPVSNKTYEYFTDFSYLGSDDYKKYLTKKYGTKLVEAIREKISNE